MQSIPGDHHGDEDEIEAEQNEWHKMKQEYEEDYYNDRMDNE